MEFQTYNGHYILKCGVPRILSPVKSTMLKEKEVHWFPLRIRNSSLPRLENIKELLDHELSVISTYVPYAFVKINSQKMGFMPSLLNYIFVRVSLEKLRKIKGDKGRYEPLRFIMHPVFDKDYNKSSEVLYVTDKLMDDFIRVTSEANEKVIFLDNLDYACRPSQLVQIVEGPFTGVIGRIKRIRGNRCVVIPIGRELAAAITDLPRKHLRYLDPET